MPKLPLCQLFNGDFIWSDALVKDFLCYKLGMWSFEKLKITVEIFAIQKVVFPIMLNFPYMPQSQQV